MCVCVCASSWLRLVVLLPLLHQGWCNSYTESAVPKGMKTAIFAGGAVLAREHGA